MLNETLQTETDATFKTLLEILSFFKQEELDVIPFAGSWTAGQCTEHIVKATSGMPKICNGNTEATNRPADEKMDAIKRMFLDMDTKFQSPEFIRPVETNHNLNELKATLKTICSDIMEIAKTQDLRPICKEFEVPGFGPFTKYELLGFALTHTQRHTQQLKRIHNALTKKP